MGDRETPAIPEEAGIAAVKVFVDQIGVLDWLEPNDRWDAVHAIVGAAAPLIVAAEHANDTGLSVLREMAAQVDSDSAAMAFVGAFLRYADERDVRAAELRGGEPR